MARRLPGAACSVRGTIATIALVLATLAQSGCADRVRLAEPVWSGSNALSTTPTPSALQTTERPSPPPPTPDDDIVTPLDPKLAEITPEGGATRPWQASATPPDEPGARSEQQAQAEERETTKYLFDRVFYKYDWNWPMEGGRREPLAVSGAPFDPDGGAKGRWGGFSRPSTRSAISFGETGERLGVLPTEVFLTYDLESLCRTLRAKPPSTSAPAESSTERPKHHGRVALELFVMVGPFGTTWYWYNQDFNRSDWELKWDAKSWERKLITFDAVRFDSNHFTTNAFFHPFATGMWYHVAGRTNNFSVAESLLLSSAASGAWEYFAEFKELVSLNDVFLTPFGGMPFGEAFYQFGEMFSRGRATSLNGAFALVFGLPKRFHAWLDDEPIPAATETDSLGFPTDVAHAFELSGGAGFTTMPLPANQTRVRTELGVRAEVITVPLYGKPASVPLSFTDESFTDVTARLTMAGGTTTLASALATVSFAGLYWQDIKQGAADELRGSSVYLGLGSSYEYTRRAMPELEDRWAVAGVLGPLLDVSDHRSGITTRVKLALFGDIAMVSPYALNPFLAGLRGRPTKSELSFDHYYFGGGLSLLPEVSIRGRWFDIGASARLDYIGSIEGFDRREEEVVVRAVARDLRASTRVWIGYVFPEQTVKLSVSREDVVRSSRLSSYEATGSDTKYLGSLSLLF